ncbi:hypothetical protein BpHYR1_022015 [Brachionus plicatilis]|uniref:Uncharacterized protein n=1 Tax=Brachionus plicatilis TaxID=10195 RepID=A0A3M7PMB3_BRAPC|nr:hypothetical protein BpHYR1_022015 [Brachionus plicatilis]
MLFIYSGMISYHHNHDEKKLLKKQALNLKLESFKKFAIEQSFIKICLFITRVYLVEETTRS